VLKRFLLLGVRSQESGVRSQEEIKKKKEEERCDPAPPAGAMGSAPREKEKVFYH
jgi:hypothetical protein